MRNLVVESAEVVVVTLTAGVVGVVVMVLLYYISVKRTVVICNQIIR